MKITDHLRRQTVAEHLATGRTQAETRAAFELATGMPLGERTLRSWIKRFSPSKPTICPSADERGVLVAVLQRLRDFQNEIEHALAANSGAAPAQPVAAAPATTASPPLLAEPAAGSHPAKMSTEVCTPARRFSFDD